MSSDTTLRTAADNVASALSRVLRNCTNSGYSCIALWGYDLEGHDACDQCKARAVLKDYYDKRPPDEQ